MFNKGEGGFLDRDLYVFCENVETARPSPLATRIVSKSQAWTSGPAKDSTGKPYGAEPYAAYQKPEGEITEVSYMLQRVKVLTRRRLQKVTLATRVNLGCGVTDITSRALPLVRFIWAGMRRDAVARSNARRWYERWLRVRGVLHGLDALLDRLQSRSEHGRW